MQEGRRGGACLRQQEREHHAQAGLDILQRQILGGGCRRAPCSRATRHSQVISCCTVPKKQCEANDATLGTAHLKRGTRPVMVANSAAMAATMLSILTSK